MDVTVQYFDGCPNWRQAEERLRVALDRTGRSDVPIVLELVESDSDARRVGFRGSPTILLDGVDPFVLPEAPDGLTCRLYVTPTGVTGSPTREQLIEVLHDRPA